jgi:hypothetical protein
MGLPQMVRVIASKLKAVMKIFTPWKLILLAIFTVVLSSAPRAIADDINPDADVPDISTTDATPVNSVLEIPQQCDSDSVAVLCDRSADDSSMTADANAPASNLDASGSNDVASNPNVGSVYDYANQNITNEASAMGTMSVPLGYVSGYPTISPAPMVVSGGPGSYQQWTGGPGSYRQWAPGPGYIAPMPLGYRPSGLGGAFGPHLMGGFRGHFGH